MYGRIGVLNVLCISYTHYMYHIVKHIPQSLVILWTRLIWYLWYSIGVWGSVLMCRILWLWFMVIQTVTFSVVFFSGINGINEKSTFEIWFLLYSNFLSQTWSFELRKFCCLQIYWYSLYPISSEHTAWQFWFKFVWRG